MLDSLRCTGRTTRMVEEAIRLAKEGKMVYLVFNTVRDCREFSLKHRLTEHRLIKTFHMSHPDLNWETMQIDYGLKDAVTLVDHYVIECRYSKVLDMLHRFDPPTVRV